MNNLAEIFEKYKNKRVLITGHTGFKGAWLCRILLLSGANITGYALEPINPSLFNILNLKKYIHSVFGDIRDYRHLQCVFDEVKPEIVIHLAAQPIVRLGYTKPRETYEINVMGTVNVCECVRMSKSVQSFLNVTTDKVYQNKEWAWGYRELDVLNGFDPYSNSKSCSELVTHSYINSFYEKKVAVSTVRAGNVIGGGDFAVDRIIPDCIRAAIKGKDIIVRNPYSVRPYQHVLEPLFVYLLIAEKQLQNSKFSGFYNIGPDESDCVTTEELVSMFCETWGDELGWKNHYDNGPSEANFLKLDCSLLKRTFAWKPRWNIKKAIEKTVEWTKLYVKGDINEVSLCVDRQIKDFLDF